MYEAILPIVPEFITVHLGVPTDATAQNVQVSFIDYIKNVASSEIYPTWPESAIKANILAQISFALNRVYLEWYRSMGYDFDITNSTQYDQAFVYGRNIFENISQLVDELFNQYIVRGEAIEPYFAEFCNGTTSTCPGLSQWGTVELAEQGYTPLEILQYYYGDNIQ
ncbi:MAG: SpoIID/LytB domain-containing protein, partial [Clostridiales bacterium]